MYSSILSFFQPARRRFRRRQQGALVLIILCALLLVVLVYLGFQYCLFSGSSREVRNAVDASMLNVAKKVTEVKVAPTREYQDCADMSGMLGIANLGRMWGKSYLINANVDEMDMEGLITRSAKKNGDLAHEVALDINNQLLRALTSRATLNSYFANMSDKRRIAMLKSAEVSRSIEDSYLTAMVDRGAEGNMEIEPSALPQKAAIEYVAMGGKNYVKGYTPVEANDKYFYFMSFRKQEVPHLISESAFMRDRCDCHPLNNFATAIPNSFQGSGTANGATISLSAVASSVANPQREYRMAIPHAFFRLIFVNNSIWHVDHKTVAIKEYKPFLEIVKGIEGFELKDKRILHGWATLGQEWDRKQSLYEVIEGIPGNHTLAYNRLVQRGKEIDPDFDLSQLITLLQNQKPHKSMMRYIIYPRYETEDLVDPVLHIAPEDPSILPPWIEFPLKEAEGKSKEVLEESPLYKDKVRVLIQGPPPDCPKHMTIFGKYFWSPGTGMQPLMNLGDLMIYRQTDVYYEPGTEHEL